MQSLIHAVFGESTPQYQNFLAQYEDCRGGSNEVKGLKGLFQSAKEDFDSGYVFNVDLRVSGEIFGDFVVLAKHAISQGQKDVAAVLASAALEDALKRFASVNGLSVDGQTMQDVINALKSKGLVAGAQKSLLDAMPKIRNYALHANWDKISEMEVSSVIGFVESWRYLKPELTIQTRRIDPIAAAKLKLFKDSNQPQQKVDPYAYYQDRPSSQSH